MDEKTSDMRNNNDQFVIFLADCKPPTYKKAKLIIGKKASDIKHILNLKNEYALAIRTPTYIQYADPNIIMTDTFPNLIQNHEFDFSYAIQIINNDEINSIKFIFQCEVDNFLDDPQNIIKMPNFLVQFHYDEFLEKSGNDVLNKIINNFGLPIEKPQLFINDEIIDFSKIEATELFKRLQSDKNKNIFKCHLTKKAIEMIEKRKTQIQEMIKTETVYLEQLNYLFNSFLIRVKHAGIFSNKMEKYNEFKECLQKIFKYQTNFFIEIKSMIIGYETEISKVFLKFGDSLSVNQDLVRQYAKLQLLMDEIKYSGKLHNTENSVFSTNKINLKQITEIPFHPSKYVSIIKKIREETPKSHIDYDFLCMAEVKMMIFCSDIDASLSKFKYSFETINLLNRFDETGSSVCLNGQSLKNKYDISIRNKKPGTLYLFDERILLTSKNGFGKNLKETVYFFNKIKNQSFILCSDSKMESIIFIKDENTSFNVVFESRDKRNSFLEDFRSIRQNRLFQKSFQIFAEEVVLTSFGEIPPPHIYGHSAVSLSSMMIFFTGGSTDVKKDHCSPIVTFNSISNESFCDFEAMTPSPDMRLTFEKKNLNGKTVISLFLFGGKKNRSVFTFSKKNWIQLPGDATFTRVRHSFVSFKGNLVVFGGLDEQNKPTNDLWIYDILKNEWNKPILNEKIPPPRFDHSAVIYKNVMIIHGGRNNDNKICDTWLFDFNKMEWNQIKLSRCVSIVPRSGHSALIVNQFMLIFGGEGYENHPFALNIETMRIIKLKFIGNYVLGMNDFAADLISNPNNENEKQIICFGGFNADKSIIINSFTKLYLPDEITNPDQMPSEDV